MSLLVTALLALGLFVPAGALPLTGDSSLRDGELTWRINANVASSASLNEISEAESPATRNPENGTLEWFAFPLDPDASRYDPDTGEGALVFEGAARFGNTTRGNYWMRLADLTVDLQQGRATLGADVQWFTTTGSYQGQPVVGGTSQPTRVAQAVVFDATVTDDGQGTVTLSDVRRRTDIDPPAGGDPMGFTQSFVDHLPSSLEAWFYGTGGGSDAGKPADPITLSFTYETAGLPGGGQSGDQGDDTAQDDQDDHDDHDDHDSGQRGGDAPETDHTGTPGATGHQSTSGPRTITDGQLDWGVKASFRNYITGPIANGSADTRDGAREQSDGTYRFPITGGEVAGMEVDASGVGTVHFTGHDGQLDLVLSDPRVVLDGGTGILSLDVRSRDADDPDRYLDADGVPFALLHIDEASFSATTSRDTATWSNVTATLTEEGAEAFGGFYEAGEQLDPLTLTVALDDAALPRAAGGSGALPDTGRGASTAALASLLASLAGAVLLRRSRTVRAP